jgi:hypothetical protein
MNIRKIIWLVLGLLVGGAIAQSLQATQLAQALPKLSSAFTTFKNSDDFAKPPLARVCNACRFLRIPCFAN